MKNGGLAVAAVPGMILVLLFGMLMLGGGGAAADCSTSPGGKATDLVLTGTADDKAVAFMRWLMVYPFEALDGKPMNREQAAGVAGNVMQESGFNPSAVNSIGASGLFQWLGGRKTGLEQFAATAGTSWDDATTQMLWLAQELATSHNDVAEAMLASSPKTPREWAKFWDDEFEISGNDQIERRMDNAEHFYTLDIAGLPTCDGTNPTVGLDGWTSPAAPGNVASSEYGERWGRLHAGIDLPAGCGSPIFAAQAGTVRIAGSYAGYGNAVVIDHADGVSTLYGHMPWGALRVSAGEKVGAGQQIGEEGDTGRSYGCHLHFEVHINDAPIDPRPFMAERGIDFGPLAPRD